jgi:hypothetical protein
MSFGSGCEVGQSTGEFYFLDVPVGMYELVFDIDMVADTFMECGRCARERHLLLDRTVEVGGKCECLNLCFHCIIQCHCCLPYTFDVAVIFTINIGRGGLWHQTVQ